MMSREAMSHADRPIQRARIMQRRDDDDMRAALMRGKDIMRL